MLGSLTESPTVRGSVSVCGIGGMNGTKSAVYHFHSERRAVITREFIRHGRMQ